MPLEAFCAIVLIPTRERLMFVTIEIENGAENAASLISVAGVGDTAESSQRDAIEYLCRTDKTRRGYEHTVDDGEKTWDYWQDCAGDSGFALLTLELAAIPPEWEVKPCDKE